MQAITASKLSPQDYQSESDSMDARGLAPVSSSPVPPPACCILASHPFRKGRGKGWGTLVYM
jgi:hypothetical protein